MSCTGTSALADLHGNRVRISTMLVPDVVPGDWVLIHAGFAIQRLSEQDVKLTWDVIHDAQRAAAAAQPGDALKTAASGAVGRRT